MKKQKFMPNTIAYQVAHFFNKREPGTEWTRLDVQNEIADKFAVPPKLEAIRAAMRELRLDGRLNWEKCGKHMDTRFRILPMTAHNGALTGRRIRAGIKARKQQSEGALLKPIADKLQEALNENASLKMEIEAIKQNGAKFAYEAGLVLGEVVQARTKLLEGLPQLVQLAEGNVIDNWEALRREARIAIKALGVRRKGEPRKVRSDVGQVRTDRPDSRTV